MAKYDIGEYIYDVRKRLGYTQEELAEGICTTGTLSKIENGSRVPTTNVYEALMRRLGEPVSVFSVYTGRRELVADNMCRKLMRILARQDTRQAEILMYEYDLAQRKYQLAESQLMCCIKGICHAQLGEAPEIVLEELLSALKKRRPESVKRWLEEERKWMTFDEIIIWNNIAIQYKKMGDYQIAWEILYRLREYLRNRETDGEERAKIYPTILFNLMGLASLLNLYIEAVDRCKEGIRICVEYGKLYPLPYFLKYKGRLLAVAGEQNESEKCIRWAKLLLEIMQRDEAEMYEEMMTFF